MEKHKCQFEYEGWRCNEDGIAIARCKDLCSIHFSTVCGDNTRRFNKQEDIPIKMVFTKKLTNGQSRPGLLTIKVEKEVKK